jgi:RNAse (barnase) inhibitor barstar
MPRKRKEEKEEKEDSSKKKVRKESIENSSKSISKISKRKSFDIDSWIDERLNDLAVKLEIEYLNLDKNLLKDIIKRIVELLWEEDKRPDMDRLSNRIKRNIERLRTIIAQMIIESGVSLSNEMLEYVTTSAGPWILSYASSLYKIAKDRGREDLINIMRGAWVKWWIQIRGTEIPPECPRCKFNSLMSDGTCIVCGYTPSASELLKYNNFDLYVDNLIKKGDLNRAKLILEKGYVIISSTGIKSPDEERYKFDIEVHLPTTYKEKILSHLKELGKT